MHIHLRQQEPDKGHLPSWDVGISSEIQQAIREACPGVIINHTTGTSGPNYQGALDCVPTVIVVPNARILPRRGADKICASGRRGGSCMRPGRAESSASATAGGPSMIIATHRI